MGSTSDTGQVKQIGLTPHRPSPALLLMDGQVINATSDHISYWIDVREHTFFGLEAEAAVGSTTTMDISLIETMEVDSDGVPTGGVAPAVYAAIGSLADKNKKIFVVNPTPCPYIAIKVIGTGSNSADSTITLRFWADNK